MIKKIERNYLEINSLEDLKEPKDQMKSLSINLVNPSDFQLNKFFYKNIGKKHNWVDRLIWEDKQWIEYTSSKNLKTYTLKKKC